MKNILLLLSLFIITAATLQLKAQNYSSPESIVFDSKNNRYLISNAGNGTILALNPKTNVKTTFVSGLTSPKGMVIVGNNLYVTDVTKVRGFSLTNGSSVLNLTISGASFLNDIASNSSNYLFVTDMNAHKIFRVSYLTGAYITMVNSGITSPNGIIYDAGNSRLIICSYRTNSPIQSIDATSGAVSVITNTSISNLDGLTVDDSGFVYVSSWTTNTIYRFNSKFTTGPAAYYTGFNGPADIFYNTEAKVLAIPDMTNDTVVFKDLLYAEINVLGKKDICPATSTVLATVTGSALSYIWKRNGLMFSTAANVIVSSGGSYTVEVSNHIGKVTTSAVTITQLTKPPTPSIYVQGKSQFCAGDSTYLVGPVGYNYYWSNNDTLQKVKIKTTGVYTLEITDANGCKSDLSNPIGIVVGPLTPKAIINFNNITKFCDGDSIVLNGLSGYKNYWSNGDSSLSIVIKKSDTISLIVKDYINCYSTSSDTITFTKFPLPATPVISFTGNTTFCDGDSIVLHAPKGFLEYEWSDGSNDSINIIYQSSVNIVSVVDKNKCKSLASPQIDIVVFQLPATPIITTLGKTDFCEGDSVILETLAGYFGYEWSNGDTIERVMVDTSGIFNVRVKDNNNCYSLFSDSIVVISYPIPDRPVISFNKDTIFCEGDSVILSGPDNYAVYFWSDNSKDKSIVVKSNETLTLYVDDTNLCRSPVSFPISIQSKPVPAKPSVLAIGKDSLGSSVSGDSYKWYFNYLELPFTTKNILALNKGNFKVLVMQSECASDTSDSYFFIPESIQENNYNRFVIYPNPNNGDFTINFDSKLSVKSLVEIYNWEGKLMFSSFVTEAENQINTDLSTGLYLLKVQNASGISYRKLFIR